MEADLLLARASPLTDLERSELERQFDELLAAHGAALGRLAASYTNTASDRDDLLQEIAVAIWQALPRYRGECSPRTFIFRIAHNRAIAYLSRARSQAHAVDEEMDVRDPAPDPESGLACEERSRRLHQAVHRLPVPYRQVITLTLEGLDYSEIGEVLGISGTNVGARLTRARQMLRELLEERK